MKEFALHRDVAGAYGFLDLPELPQPARGQVLLRPELNIRRSTGPAKVDDPARVKRI